MPVDEDYYKPIITKGSFNNSYIQYESIGDEGEDKNLLVEKYLDRIKPYLRDTINDHKTRGEWRVHSGNKIIKQKTKSEWKIQLTMAINFISSKKDSDETRIMPKKSDNIEIMMGSETDGVIEELFNSLRQIYQKGLEESMDGSHFTFDGVNALYYDRNKVSLSKGRSYIDSSEWLKNKKATINPQNEKDDKCFHYTLTVALNYKQAKKDPHRVSKIKPLIDQYNWKEIDFTSHRKDWKKFESNNKSIALNILYVPHNTKEIRHAYKSNIV